MRIATLIAVLASTGACASVRSRADTAFADGRYLDAAELYGQLGDADAIAHRDAARVEALKELRAAYHRAATAGGAADELTILLGYRDNWGAAFDVTPELDQTGMYLTGLVATRTPLAAEVVLADHRALLAHTELRPRREALHAIVAGAARDACDALAPSTPYLTWLVDRYCAHFAIDRADALPLPDLVGGLDLTGGITGETDAQRAELTGALARAFRDSAWFSPDAPVVTGTLAGSLAVGVTSRTVTLSKDWVETVSYQDTETRSEPYEESYQDTETYSEMVPVTSTRQVPCGDTTCSESYTDYQSQTNTRSVTKYRTAYRDVTETVTKYRDEPRVFTYDATEYTGHDTAALAIHSDVGDASVAIDTTQVSYEHDVTFAPAGIAPLRANLSSAAELAATEQDALVAKLRVALVGRYQQRYCTAETFTPEAAARCRYGAPAPAAAHAALATVFGADEPLLGTLRR